MLECAKKMKNAYSLGSTHTRHASRSWKREDFLLRANRVVCRVVPHHYIVYWSSPGHFKAPRHLCETRGLVEGWCSLKWLIRRLAERRLFCLDTRKRPDATPGTCKAPPRGETDALLVIMLKRCEAWWWGGGGGADGNVLVEFPFRSSVAHETVYGLTFSTSEKKKKGLQTIVLIGVLVLFRRFFWNNGEKNHPVRRAVFKQPSCSILFPQTVMRVPRWHIWFAIII